jgi:hypothetical protein
MEKVEEYQFSRGQYTTVEAQKILLGLINSKINFHQLEHFSNEIRFNENNNHSKIRIELLTNAAKISDLIAYSTLNGMEFKIEGTIKISKPVA